MEETLRTNDDGTMDIVEPYVSKAGNIVTHPTKRSKGPLKDPRQDIAWEIYVKGWRDGRPNAREAGLQAGYALNTAINLPNLTWFKERKDKLRRSKMLSKAERNLSRILDMDYSKMRLRDDGSEEEVVDKDILRVVADVSKSIVTTLGKDEGYSTKTEVSGKMQGDIKINSISYADKALEIENEVVDESVKMIETEIIKEVVKEDGNNTSV